MVHGGVENEIVIDVISFRDEISIKLPMIILYRIIYNSSVNHD